MKTSELPGDHLGAPVGVWIQWYSMAGYVASWNSMIAVTLASWWIPRDHLRLRGNDSSK
jgi:hypothetical protein